MLFSQLTIKDNKNIFQSYLVTLQLNVKTLRKQSSFWLPQQVKTLVVLARIVVLRIEFYRLEDKQRQWMAFVNRTTKTAVSFKQIMNRVKDFLFPIYESLLNEKEFSMQWIAERKAWRNYGSC